VTVDPQSQVNPQALVSRYAAIARPLLLSFTKPECRNADCIGATRMALWCFEALGLRAEPIAMTWVVQAPSLQFAFVCGLRGEVLEAAKLQAANYTHREVAGGQGWDGHLVLAVEGRWLVDSTFDQCAAHRDLDIPPTVLVVDCGSLHPRDAAIRANFTTDKGIPFSVDYQPLDGEDDGWRNSEAWNQPELQWAGYSIAAAILAKR